MRGLLKTWRKNQEGSALMEAAVLFPTLLVMIFGIYDVGHAITANHKMITASQMIADLVTRNVTVTDDDIDEAITAARLAMQPYVTSNDGFGIDIVSVQFDDDDEPVALWRETRNMAPDADLVDKTTGLGTEGGGAVAISMVFDYRPTFGNVVIEQFRMREVAFARGRKSATVTKD